MTISLSTIESDVLWIQAATLAVVGIMITIVVYGVVAIIVKMDDVGLWLTEVGRTSATRALGRGIVAFMPWFLKLLSVVGTAAMLWVGGSIIVHSAHQMGWHWPEETIYAFAKSIAQGDGLVEWLVKAVVDGILGFVVGLILIPIATKLIAPLFGAKSAH